MNDRILQIEEENDVVICDPVKFLFNLRYLEFRISQFPGLRPKTVINLIETSGLCMSDKALLEKQADLLLYPKRGRPVLTIRS